MKLSVVIPVYNEASTILQVIERVKRTPFEKEIIVVDDGSSDGTSELLKGKTEEIKLLIHEKNRGKGAAIRTAIPFITGEVVIIQDADLEYNPLDYPKLIAPIEEGVADVVYGSRFQSKNQRAIYFWNDFGNRMVTRLSNLFSHLHLSDMETGYKVFRAEILKKIKIESNRFGFEPEITAKIAKLGFRVCEVPISYKGRDYSEGKKINWKDGLAAIYWILKFNLFR